MPRFSDSLEPVRCGDVSFVPGRGGHGALLAWPGEHGAQGDDVRGCALRGQIHAMMDPRRTTGHSCGNRHHPIYHQWSRPTIVFKKHPTGKVYQAHSPPSLPFLSPPPLPFLSSPAPLPFISPVSPLYCSLLHVAAAAAVDFRSIPVLQRCWRLWE